MIKVGGSVWRFFHVYVRHSLLSLRIKFLTSFFGMKIAEGVKISLKANLDKTNPKGINLGKYTYIAFVVAILTHDMSRGIYKDVHLGENYFIGARSIILPGVTIENHSVIAAGSVVTKNIPPNSLNGGNPAKFIRNINTSKLGVLVET